MCFSTATHNNRAGRSKYSAKENTQTTTDSYCPILPGLPDDVAKFCLALLPRSFFPAMGVVCKRWRSFIQCKEFITVRKEAGKLEELLYVLTADNEGKGSHWEILGNSGNERWLLPPMPCPAKAGFGVVALHGKILVMAGYSINVGTECVSADVYQYDSLLNSWNKLADMNVARFHFACAEVNGIIYAVGGYGANGDSLSSAEVYNPEKHGSYESSYDSRITIFSPPSDPKWDLEFNNLAEKNEWALIESLRRPRWGCFACSLEGKLYVMGGRSSFTIGHSKIVDVYTPENHSWFEMKHGCVMVTAHAVIGRRLFCMEWKNQRKVEVFDPTENSWKKVEVPLNGSSAVGFRFGILDGKLLLFSMRKDLGYETLVYDPEAERGSEWQTTSLQPSGSCLCSVTIEA